MRLRTLISRIAVAISLLAACTISIASTVLPDPTISDLAGAWIGPDDQIAYFRLEIDRSGRGHLVAWESSPDTEVSYYEVTGTELKGYLVSFNLRPVGDADPSATLVGAVSRDGLDLDWSGINHDFHWHSPVKLQREDHLLEQIEHVRKASIEYRARSKK